MEKKLADQARSGSMEAFCELYGLYKDRLYRYALCRLGIPEDAEDAVSECVLAAWQSIGGLRSSEAFGAWIFRILSNCCAGHIKNSIAARENIEAIYRDSQDSACMWQSPSLSAELSEALSQLSDEDRSIVLLSVIGDLNSSEIAELTGLPPGTIRSKMSRGLAKMRSYLS